MASILPVSMASFPLSPLLKLILYHVFIEVIPLLALGFWVFQSLRQPVFRRESAMIFLEMIESALKQGVSVENAIVNLSLQGEKSMGKWFHILALEIEKGARFGKALEKVPMLLPQKVVAMLRVGEEMGDLRRVIPACRLKLQDGQSESLAAMNYQIVFAFALSPVILLMTFFISNKITPVFYDILAGYKTGMPLFSKWVFNSMGMIAGVQLMLSLLVYFFGTTFLGARKVRWKLGKRFSRLIAYCHSRTAWNRLRIKRDFASMLALLLDSGVPEERALMLAGSATGSQEFAGRAAVAAGKVREGVKLTSAMEGLDESGEFRWRLENAVHSNKRGGFTMALKGWCDSLDAQAFQKEQVGAQLFSTALLVLNAALVALMAAAVLYLFNSISQIPFVK
jgi:type II secretory pathway component PulF